MDPFVVWLQLNIFDLAKHHARAESLYLCLDDLVELAEGARGCVPCYPTTTCQ